MEVSATVKVQDPETGRMVTVFMNDQEVTALLSVGLNVLLAQGMISLGNMEQEKAPASSELN